jgi:hypothetical protein
MYLRKNKVRLGDGHRLYYSIAHNVWHPRANGMRPKSRRVPMANLGSENDVDPTVAREIVIALVRCMPRPGWRRGEGRAATLRLALSVRRLEPLLRMLASRELGLSEHVPHAQERASILEALIRDQIASPHGDLSTERLRASLELR